MGEASSVRRRIRLLDTLRGLAVTFMIIFHTEYDLVFMFDALWLKEAFYVQSDYSWIATALFVFLAGITIRFSHQPAKHGARVLAIAACFTLVTAFIFSGSAIYFGALHLIACGMLAYSLASGVTDKLPWWVGLLLCAALFVFTRHISEGYLGIGQLRLTLPIVLLRNNLLYPFGIISGGFSSVDYLPLVPWLFMFFCGVFVGRPVQESQLPDVFYKDICPPLTWLGKHSLLIYIIHQPIVYAILYLILCIIPQS